MNCVLDNGLTFPYNSMVIGVWRSLVSRLVRVQEASGSNPDTPTKNEDCSLERSSFLFWFVSGFEEGGRHEVTAKNVPVARFLARGRIHYPIDAPLVGVDMGYSCRKIKTL